jgi:biopolymer transport protein ExbD
MAFDPSDGDVDFYPEINTTPLVDVMLVLLIIFIITVPVMTHSVKLDLPRAQNQPTQSTPQTINLAVDDGGAVFWNTEPVTPIVLKDRIAAAAAQNPQPEFHIRGARLVPYEKVAQVLAAVQAGGIEKLGFVLDPGLQP